MKTNKLILTTRFHENRPVSVGGVGLWSKRLNGEEEMLLQEVNLSAISSKAGEKLRGEVELLRHIVGQRVRDGREITTEWVVHHLGHANGDRLIQYLRTGEGLAPGESLDLPTFEPIELEGRRFTAHALTYAEALAAAAKADELNALGIAEEAQSLGDQAASRDDESAEQMLNRVHGEAMELHGRSVGIVRATAELVAQALNARIADGGDPIDGAWLLSHLNNEGLGAITSYLRDGSTPAAQEEEAPNADGDAPASS